MNREDILLFFERLSSHDWFYFYSDDSNINTRGIINETEIRRLASKFPLFQTMYNEFYEAKFNGKKIPILEKYLK